MSLSNNLIPPYDDALTSFREGYMHLNNFEERSQVEYETDIRQLLDFLVANGIRSISTISKEHLEDFCNHLDNQELAPATKRKKIFAVKAFFQWEVAKGELSTDPSEGIIVPLRSDDSPRVLIKSEQDKLLDVVDNVRDKAIILLFLGTGITCSEIAKIRLPDIYDLNISTNITTILDQMQVSNTSSGTLHIPGKKERTIPLDHITSEALLNWLRERPNTECKSIFLSQKLEPLSEDGYKFIVEGYLKKADIANASIRTLRHTFTVNMLNSGKTEKQVKKLLGIKSLSI